MFVNNFAFAGGLYQCETSCMRILISFRACNGTELHPQSVHHTVHPQIMSWQESSDLSLKVSPHVRRGARLRKKKEKENNGDGRHGYKMATVAMVIISDRRLACYHATYYYTPPPGSISFNEQQQQQQKKIIIIKK